MAKRGELIIRSWELKGKTTEGLEFYTSLKFYHNVFEAFLCLTNKKK